MKQNWMKKMIKFDWTTGWEKKEIEKTNLIRNSKHKMKKKTKIFISFFSFKIFIHFFYMQNFTSNIF